MPNTVNTPRAPLVAALLEAGRESSTASLLFHAAVAEHAGLCPTDHKTLDVLRRRPLTAGEISTHTGLASASVTSLIDRLESRGLVRRTGDPGDRRRVIVEPVPERVSEVDQLFDALGDAITRMLQRYDEAELETIRSFLTSTAAVLREETQRLEAAPAAEADAGRS